MTKRKSLSCLGTEYLRDLAHNLNGSRRDYSSASHDTLLDRVSQKLTVEEVDTVCEVFQEGTPPKEAADIVTPASARDIRKSVEQSFDDQGLYEVKIGQRWCDLVFPEEITAVEIKSARDRIDRAVAQVNQYKQWADTVYLVYDESHSKNIPSAIRDNGVGLLEFSDGEMQAVKDAEADFVEAKDRLIWMTHDALAKHARSYNIRVRGGKEAITHRLESKLSDSENRDIFKEYLKSRA